jgi:hypothetical protein
MAALMVAGVWIRHVSDPATGMHFEYVCQLFVSAFSSYYGNRSIRLGCQRRFISVEHMFLPSRLTM